MLRSASFHGTGGTLSLANEWSDNELNYSQDENQAPPPCSLQLVWKYIFKHFEKNIFSDSCNSRYIVSLNSYRKAIAI